MPLFGKAKKKEPEPFTPNVPYAPEQFPADQQAYPNQPLEMQGQGYSPQQIYGAEQQGMQPLGMQPAGMPFPPPEQQGQAIDKEKIEEVAEAIIDEKWNELIKDINKMVEWKEKTESRLLRIEEDIKNLTSNFEALHRGILGKITEYDQNLLSVGTEIKAMEKVFQKILPTFTENVNKLSRLTKGIPDSPPAQKTTPTIKKK